MRASQAPAATLAHPAQVAVELTDEHACEAAPLRAVRVHHVMLGVCP